MKVTNGLSLFLQFDKLHDRIDLQRPTSHVLAGIAALWWTFLGDADGWQFMLRLISIIIFAIVIRLLLTRLGASRLSSFAVLVIALLLVRAFSPEQVMLVNVVALTLLLVQEYFVVKTKVSALFVGVAMAVLAAGAGAYEPRLLILFAVALIARILWHALIERMGRKQFIIYGTKVVAMLFIAPLLWWILRSLVQYDIKIDTYLPEVTVPGIAVVLGGVLIVRGMWATLLLQTAKSPKERGLRIFYVALAIAWIIFVAVMNRYASGIFTPDAYHALSDAGLVGYNVAMGGYALLCLGLFFTAGIDRSLYKDTRISRAVQHKLAPSQPK